MHPAVTDGRRRKRGATFALKWAIFVSQLLAMSLLEGCATLDRVQPTSIAASGAAQNDIEIYPAWVIKVAEPVAPLIGFAISRIAWRHGYLWRNEAVLSSLSSEMRPLDIILVSNKGRLSGRAGSGLFSHAAVYLGSERDLRLLGIWEQLAPDLREKVASGRTIIESAQRHGTELSSLDKVADTNRIALLRPRDRGTRWRRTSLKTLSGLVGAPFDNHFRLDENEALFCTEVVDLGMPQLQLPRRHAYGRELILPDDIALHATAKRRLSVVGYFRANAQSWAALDGLHLARDIALHSENPDEPGD